MKTSITYLLTCFLLFWAGKNLYAQPQAMKFGKVDKKDFTRYEPTDSTTVAVFLNKEGFTYYRIVGEGHIQVESEFKFRLQVLRPEGVHYANITIPFYQDERVGYTSEQVKGISASAYNLVDGKVEKTPLERKYIFEEKLMGYTHLCKFSIPNVKPGTIIEYKYKLYSNNPFRLNNWLIQEDIPVQFAYYEVDIPEPFQFRITGQGQIPLERKQEKSNSHISTLGYDGHVRNVLNNRYMFTCIDVPALKDEPMVWSKENYRGGVSFEISAIDFMMGPQEHLRTTWNDVCEELKWVKGFGDYANMGNPLKEEQRQLGLDASLPVTQKALRLRQLLAEHIQWDGTYGFTTDISPRQCLKQKHGNNAALNFIYLAMLRDAGIQASPILVRDKRLGDLIGNQPSLERLTTFIVGLTDEKGNIYCTDCSLPWISLNLLPPQLMTNLGILYTMLDDKQQRFISLADIGEHTSKFMVEGQLTAEGELQGKLTTSHTGLQVLDVLKDLPLNADSAQCTSVIEKQYGIHIVDYKRLADDASRENIRFTKNYTCDKGSIYFTPFLLKGKIENPFPAGERTFPVEFPSKYKKQFYALYQLPEGYEPENLPNPIRLKANRGVASISCIITRQPNGLQALLELNVNQSIVAPQQYEELRQLWEQLIEKSQTTIVLKKQTL